MQNVKLIYGRVLDIYRVNMIIHCLNNSSCNAIKLRIVHDSKNVKL